MLLRAWVVILSMQTENESKLTELLKYDTIAVVGCSGTPGKAAHEVPAYFKCHEYEIISVNPFTDEIFGRRPYDSLANVTEEVDPVEIFRPSEEIAGIVSEALERDDIEAIWMQAGIEDDVAAERAEDAGLSVVQDHCLKVQHGLLIR